MPIDLARLPVDQLRSLADAIRPVINLAADGFQQLPPEDEDEFWANCARLLGQDDDLNGLATSLAEAVQEELEVLQVARVRPGLLVASDASVFESPLAMLLLGVRGVVVICPDGCSGPTNALAVPTFRVSVRQTRPFVAAAHGTQLTAACVSVAAVPLTDAVANRSKC